MVGLITLSAVLGLTAVGVVWTTAPSSWRLARLRRDRPRLRLAGLVAGAVLARVAYLAALIWGCRMKGGATGSSSQRLC